MGPSASPDGSSVQETSQTSRKETFLCVNPSILGTSLLNKTGFLLPPRLRNGDLEHGVTEALFFFCLFPLVDQRFHPRLPSQTSPSDLSHHLTSMRYLLEDGVPR